MAEVSLHSIGCPACAGTLKLEEGTDVLECSHCGTPYLYGSGRDHARRYFPARLERLEAVGRAARWLAQARDTPGDMRAAVFCDAHLLYVPIWEVRAYVVGWEFGVKWRTKREIVRSGEEQVVQLQLVDEASESGFFDERRMYQEAADLVALGMGRPHVTGRELSLPLIPGELEEGAAFLEPDRGHSEVLERARTSFRRPPTGAAARDRRFFLLKESVTLLYYPVWALRYRYHGRLYDMTVDGRTGLVHSARAPADNTRRLGVMLASYAALALALALLVSLWESLPASRQAVLYAGVLVAALGGPVYWRFSLLREVRYHEPFSA